MNKGKRYSVPVTAIILFIILTFNACSAAQKSENTGAQADAVSSAVEPEAEKTDGGTVDTLDDGSYVPTLFTVTGGTGKVKITCPEVVVTEGEAQARIEFSSSHYEWVKVNDVTMCSMIRKTPMTQTETILSSAFLCAWTKR